jgi:hypothetical protein
MGHALRVLGCHDNDKRMTSNTTRSLTNALTGFQYLPGC